MSYFKAKMHQIQFRVSGTVINMLIIISRESMDSLQPTQLMHIFQRVRKR